MASYLLNAREEDMTRWKATAEREGFTFASWVRAALDAFSGEENVTLEANRPVPLIPIGHVDRYFKPDPKPERKRR